MKYKLSFQGDVTKELMLEILENEKRAFKKKFKRSKTMRAMNWVYKRKYKVDFTPKFDFELFDDHAILHIVTGVDYYVNKKRVLKDLKEYEKISEGNILVEALDPPKKEEKK